MSKPKNKTTNDAVEILHRRLVSGKPEQMAELERIRAEDAVARKIYDLRTQAGISQRALAKLVGTTASAICRLEDADYEGHSLAMLNRIAAALNKRVEIRFVSVPAPLKPLASFVAARPASQPRLRKPLPAAARKLRDRVATK
ncbi:MAG: XRE family transcriptional regulator [Prosthecobacter sp.]